MNRDCFDRQDDFLDKLIPALEEFVKLFDAGQDDKPAKDVLLDDFLYFTLKDLRNTISKALYHLTAGQSEQGTANNLELVVGKPEDHDPDEEKAIPSKFG